MFERLACVAKVQFVLLLTVKESLLPEKSTPHLIFLLDLVCLYRDCTFVLDLKMYSLRHSRSRSFAILLLLAVSGLTVISIGEIFKVYTIRSDGVRIMRRDGSTITFSMPWK